MFMDQIILALLTGLTTGGVSCLAVQGGLLTSGMAAQTMNQTDTHQPLTRTQYLLLFLLAKIVGLTVLGFILGSVGSLFQISLSFQAGLQILLGLFMLATVGNVLRIHPLFRYVVIQPPRFVFRFYGGIQKQNMTLLPRWC
jgi:uncharacterized protein